MFCCAALCLSGIVGVSEVWTYLPVHQHWGSSCRLHWENHWRLIRHWKENTERVWRRKRKVRHTAHPLTSYNVFKSTQCTVFPLLFSHTVSASQFLTVLQSGGSLRLSAGDAVSYVIGGNHTKLVRSEGLQPLNPSTHTYKNYLKKCILTSFSRKSKRYEIQHLFKGMR